MLNSNTETTMLQERSLTMTETIEEFIARGTAIVFFKTKTTEPLIDEPVKDIDVAGKIYRDHPYSNIAAVIGKENNLIAFRMEQDTEYDPDPQEILVRLEKQLGPLPLTMTIAQPNGITNLLFEYPEGRTVLKSTLETSIRIQHSNRYGVSTVLLEPSILNEGAVKIANHVGTIAKLPDRWVEYLCSSDEEVFAEPADSETEPDEAQIDVVNEGNDSTADTPASAVEQNPSVSAEEFLRLSVAKWINDKLEPAEVRENAKLLCEQYSLKVPESRLAYDIFTQYRGADPTDRYSGIAEEEALARFIAEVGLEVFRDENKELKCRIKETGEIVSLSSNMRPGNKVCDYLTRQCFQMTNAIPKNGPLRAALRVLEVQARYDREEIRLYNRVGKQNGNFYFDMGDNTAVKVNGAGWAIATAPAIFKRYVNHDVQVKPQLDGSLDEFFKYVNCEEKDKLLLAVYMVSTFVPEIAHPVLYVYGDHGSAKSSLTTKIKQVCDPSPVSSEKLTLTQKVEQVARNLSQYHVIVYDNISHISDQLSDLFCTASTGGGTNLRKLYTDEDSNIMSFKNCVILNSLKMCVTKPDLLDRSILLRLKRVRAINEVQLNARFKEALPGILGGVFDVLSKAMHLFPQIEVNEGLRMSDFVSWGYAIAEALGLHGEQFLTDYKRNISDQNELVAQGNTLCNAVLALMNNETEYISTVAATYNKLKKQVNISRQDNTFPNRDNALRPYLEELGPVLSSFGITIEFMKRGPHGVPIRITRNTMAESEEKSDSAANLANSSVILDF